jgi:hypothetical protein
MRTKERPALKFGISIASAALLLILSACAGEPGQRAETSAETAEAAKAEPSYQITGYKTKDRGEEVPEWVNRFLEREIAAVEAMPEFQNRYVFIARNGGSNFRALEQWAAGFAVELDFARLAAIRIEKRFTTAAGGFPDKAYGRYFETLIRAASDAGWEGAVKQDDFWLKRLDPEPDGNGAERYDFMILVTIDKNLLASQIQTLLSRIRPQPPPSRDQAAAVTRVRDRFFDGF